MSYGNGTHAYQQTRVIGSSREQLVPLLYERLLADLRRAGSAARAGRIEDSGVQLQHGSDIVFELLSSLDREAGGEVAERLAALYAWFISELTALMRRADADRLQRLIDIIASLHASWVEAARAMPGRQAAGT